MGASGRILRLFRLLFIRFSVLSLAANCSKPAAEKAAGGGCWRCCFSPAEPRRWGGGFPARLLGRVRRRLEALVRDTLSREDEQTGGGGRLHLRCYTGNPAPALAVDTHTHTHAQPPPPPQPPLPNKGSAPLQLHSININKKCDD